MAIDVVADRLRASWGSPGDRHAMDESVALPAATYWGPLVFLVLENFEANAEDGKVVFRTVAPTPHPRVLDLELVHGGEERLDRPGHTLLAERFRLRPTLHWLLDPLLALVVPDTSFWTLPGEPPGLALRGTAQLPARPDRAAMTEELSREPAVPGRSPRPRAHAAPAPAPPRPRRRLHRLPASSGSASRWRGARSRRRRSASASAPAARRGCCR